MENSAVISQAVELITLGIESLGIAVIVLGFLFATVRGIVHYGKRKEDAFERLKIYLGKTLQLALEFLVAADVIRTVLIDLTIQGLLGLGLLIVVRTFLSWSITVEIEGCWPWQVAKNKEG
jgi:uncharacterized membrane protein